MNEDFFREDKAVEYPDARLLQRERKVKDRADKERRRGRDKPRGNFAVGGDMHPALQSFLGKIITADCRTVLPLIPEASIDIILTSPPYNFGLDYDADRHQDARHWRDYFDQLAAIWRDCVRILKPGGRLIINIQPLFSDYVPTHHIVSCQLQEMGLLWKGEILWEKNNYNCKYTAWGSWKSPSMPYLKYTWEFVEVFCKATHKKAGRAEDIDISAEEFKEWVYAKWNIAPERNMKELGHPAVFPEKLVERLLKLFSFRGDIVLDPFNGVGTTTLVAEKLGRRFIGIELSERYCATAAARIAAWRSQPKLF